MSGTDIHLNVNFLLSGIFSASIIMSGEQHLFVSTFIILVLVI